MFRKFAVPSQELREVLVIVRNPTFWLVVICVWIPVCTINPIALVAKFGLCPIQATAHTWTADGKEYRFDGRQHYKLETAGWVACPASVTDCPNQRSRLGVVQPER